MTGSLRQRMSQRVVLDIEGFHKFARIGLPHLDAPAVTLAERAIGADEWYALFKARVDSAFNAHRYLPIYRMSHGEYIAMTGYRGTVKAMARRAVSRLLGRQGAFKSGDPIYGWEQYTSSELEEVRRRLPEIVKAIAHDGILAMALHPANPGYRQYIPAALDWLDEHGILITSENFFPFYFVYALCLGPDRRSLYKGRNILVVSGPTHGKFEQLIGALEKLGAASVQTLACHPNKSMLDILDVRAVRRPVDLILIGAGVGAANVLMQMKELSAVSIDGGYVLSVLGDPELPRRAYALGDDEFERGRLADVPEEAVRRARIPADH